MTLFITVFLVSYVIHSLGVTVGYHRLISHRAFSCRYKFVEYFWVMAGYLAFEGSPIWWATIHRAHHRHTDTALDPHSPKFGFRRAHFGWLLEDGYLPHIDPKSQSKDLIDDPLYKFLEQGGHWQRAHTLTFAACIAFRLAILVMFGWVPALASLLAGFAVLQIPLMLNVICHIPKLGYKTYATKDDSVNVWWVAILANGEGWHNNHHASPGSANSGMKLHEVDFSFAVIRFMRAIGLVKRVNVSTHEQLIKRAAATDPALAGKISAVTSSTRLARTNSAIHQAETPLPTKVAS